MSKIIIHDVGLRDGLQAEPEAIPSISKIEWAEDLAKAGVDIVQLGSFVNPKVLFQMSDTDDLFEHFQENGRPGSVVFSGLVLNEKGMERGMKCGVDMFCMGVSASETHSKKNTRMTTDEAKTRIIAMAKECMDAGKVVQASVQSAFGCGFEGDIDPDKVLGIVKDYIDAGIKKISLADTAGHANPAQVATMFMAIRELDEDVEMACHFHNTYGMGLANVMSALSVGVTSFESAFGGLGGCPFTKLAAGNVATEDMVHMMQQFGMRPDINLDDIVKVSKFAAGFLIKDLPGYVYKSGAIKH